MSVAALGTQLVVRHDWRIARRTGQWRLPRWLLRWMVLASRAGDGILWYALGGCVFAFGGSLRYIAFLSASMSAALGIGSFLALKRLVRRARPSTVTAAPALIRVPDPFSFPSGHALTAFAVTTPWMLLYSAPAVIGLLLFFAVTVAVSRVLLRVHFLSDVLAGIAIGVAVGYTSVLVLR